MKNKKQRGGREERRKGRRYYVIQLQIRVAACIKAQSSPLCTTRKHVVAFRCQMLSLCSVAVLPPASGRKEETHKPIRPTVFDTRTAADVAAATAAAEEIDQSIHRLSERASEQPSHHRAGSLARASTEQASRGAGKPNAAGNPTHASSTMHQKNHASKASSLKQSCASKARKAPWHQASCIKSIVDQAPKQSCTKAHASSKTMHQASTPTSLMYQRLQKA